MMIEGQTSSGFRSRVAVALLIVWTCLPSTSKAEPATVELTRAGRPLLPVVVGANASDATRSHAAELADYLGRMSGAEFKVEQGDGKRGIVLGRPADFDAPPLPDVSFAAGPFD